MKDTFYFSHDYNVRTDDKIKKVFRKLWLEWYWLFWCIIEDLYNNANALQLDYDWLAFDYRTTPETIKTLIEDFDLFIVEGEIFYSKSVQDRLDKRDEKSAKARENANKRWSKDNANAMQPHSESNAIKESKVKENKIKDSKEIKEINNINSKELTTEVETFWNQDINNLIKEIKEICNNLWVAYNKEKEREFAKHILTAKEFWNFCENIWQDRIMFAKNIVIASEKIKFWKGICSWPKSIYQNYSEVFNLTKSIKTKVVDYWTDFWDIY